MEVILHLIAAPAAALVVAIAFDLLIGDPRGRLHPIEILGTLITRLEEQIRAEHRSKNRRAGFSLALDCLFYFAVPLIGAWLLLRLAHPLAGFLFQTTVAGLLLSNRSLFEHVNRVRKALLRGDLAGAKTAVGLLVGRDLSRLDERGVGRAAGESLSENLVDGAVAPVLFYGGFGLPGLLLFKVVSTLDSRVGFKDERYLHLGWFAAKFDDVLCFLPARITWLAMTLIAFVLPGFSGAKCFSIGKTQSRFFPSPNSGWPEAALAGAMSRRLLGPVDREGKRVTELWIGDPGDPPGLDARELGKAMFFCLATLLLVIMVLGAAKVLFAWCLAGGRP